MKKAQLQLAKLFMEVNKGNYYHSELVNTNGIHKEKRLNSNIDLVCDYDGNLKNSYKIKNKSIEYYTDEKGNIKKRKK